MSPLARLPVDRLPLAELRALATLRALRTSVAAARCAQARERADYESQRVRNAKESIASILASVRAVQSDLRRALRAAQGVPASRAVVAQLEAARLREDLNAFVARLRVIEADANNAQARASEAGAALLRETARCESLAVLSRLGARIRVQQLDLRRADDAAGAASGRGR